jgi:nucleoside-diphosphate-sugar epimerase
VRVLVTGASGHVGSFVVRRLLRDGADVLAGNRPGSDLWRLDDVLDEIEQVPFDLATIVAHPLTVAKARPGAIVHAAWSGVTVEARDDPAHVPANVGGTLELLRQAGEAGVQAFVGLGSQAEYGPYDETLHEGLTARPTTLYGRAKLCSARLAEGMCASYGMRFAWLRLTAAYGPMDDRRHLLPSVIQELLAGRRPSLSSGTQECDYVYVGDVAEAVRAVVASDRARGILNLSAGDAWSVRALVERVRDLIDPALPLGFGERSGGGSVRGDASRLRELTGWKPGVALPDGLRATVEWERQHTR